MSDESHNRQWSFADTLRFPDLAPGPEWKRRVAKLVDLRHLGFDLGVRGLEKLAGYKRGEKLDFHIASSTRDLLADKSRVVRDEVEALAQAVMKAGHYPAKEEATRALHAVMDALREHVPPDVLSKLGDHLPKVEADRLVPKGNQAPS